MIEQLIPTETMRAYGFSQDEQIHLLGGGLINTTYLVEEPQGKKTIVQKIHPIIDPVQTRDYQVISSHLRDRGWEIPLLVPTNSGELYTLDYNLEPWRAFRFVRSDNDEPRKDSEGLGKKANRLGQLLGLLHRDLRPLEYSPVFKIPNFHDTPYYVSDLTKTLPYITHYRARELAEVALDKHDTKPDLPELGEQIIHADPKLENILSRSGSPVTFIDWDTAMLGSPWIDLGDMLRSVMKHEDTSGKPDRAKLGKMLAVIEGYKQFMASEEDPEQFANHGIQSAAAITLELAIRFLADCRAEEKGYFGWDKELFSSRQESNVAKASQGLQRYDFLQAVLEQ